MSQLNLRTRYSDDDDENVKYLTPRKYRVPQRSKLPTNHDDLQININDHVLTPTKYRQKVTKESQEEEDDEKNKQLLYKKYPVLIGDFILRKKSTDHNTIYNYQPKHTQLSPSSSVIYKGTLNSSEVQERAKNEMKQYAQERNRTSSSSPIYRETKNIDYHNQLYLRDTGYQSTTNRYSSSDDDDLIIENSDRQSRAFSVLSSPSSKFYDKNQSQFSSNPYRISTDEYDQHHFRVVSKNEQDDLSSDEEYCAAFGHEPQPKPIIHQPPLTLPLPKAELTTVTQQSTSTDNFDEFTFQEVIDIGVSTDDLILDDEPKTYLNHHQSILTTKSSRDETETYHVTKPNDTYEEPDVVPFATITYPPSISTSNPSTIDPYVNQSEIIRNKKKYSINDIDSQQSTSEAPSRVQVLPKKNSIIGLPPPPDYENVNNYRHAEPSLSNVSTKSNSSHRSAKPPTVPTHTTDGFTTNIPSRRSPSPPTDLDDEIIGGRPHFRTSRPFRPTPFRSSSRQDNEEDEYKEMHRTNGHTKPTKLISEGTQSDEKTTRNVGTMHEPVQTRNFGNEVQPQSSSTQTSFSTQKKTPKQIFTYIERPSDTQPTLDEPSYRSRRRDDTYYDHSRSPSPSPPPQIFRYTYDPRYTEHTEIRHRHTPVSPVQQRTHRSPISYRPISTTVTLEGPIYRSRTPSPQRRSHTPTPPQRSQYTTSSPRRPHSVTPRRRPQMTTQETDTSLDAMKHRQHASVQYEPTPTKEKGTSSSLRLKPQPTTQRIITYDTKYTKYYDEPERHYYIPPTKDYHYQDEEEYEEEETPSMHDQSTMAELIVSLDHYTQCESQPYMADRYVQTTPVYDNDDEQKRNSFDLPNESHIRQLPRGGSITIPQPVIIQPDTLPRHRRSQPSPNRTKHDGIDYTGNILELPIRRGQERIASTTNSPVLNIGTEHIVRQPITNEFTTPFETRYVYGSGRSSIQDRPRIINTLNSPRTNIYSNSPVRQSKSNGNFYLSPAPSRSLNSSFHLDITTNQS